MMLILPPLRKDIPVFLAQSNRIANILEAFDKVISRNKHTHEAHPRMLSEHQLLCIVDHRTSRKRKSISSHYSH
ncbi:hypothetical protein BC940DRAFT_309002 [Gongronella butleri]|nr:hypothetical protein BC940DRAFT_309002 [Gongronella butleri]